MEQAQRAQYGWWTRVQFCFWLAGGVWEPRVRWLARSLALY